MLNNQFPCDGRLVALSYFRGTPDGVAYVGVWRRIAEQRFLLRHSVAMPPASVGIHTMLLPRPLAVARGDFLGVHYPRGGATAVIGSTIAADGALPSSEMFETYTADAYHEELAEGQPMDFGRYDLRTEMKTFALQATVEYDADEPVTGNGRRRRRRRRPRGGHTPVAVGARIPVRSRVAIPLF